MTDVLEAARLVNVPLVGIATLIVAIRVNDFVTLISPGRRLVYTGAVVILAATAIGSLVKYALHRPVDPTVLLPTIGSVLILAGAWLSRHEPHRPPD